jgi:hypothetical protein
MFCFFKKKDLYLIINKMSTTKYLTKLNDSTVNDYVKLAFLKFIGTHKSELRKISDKYSEDNDAFNNSFYSNFLNGKAGEFPPETTSIFNDGVEKFEYFNTDPELSEITKVCNLWWGNISANWTRTKKADTLLKLKRIGKLDYHSLQIANYIAFKDLDSITRLKYTNAEKYVKLMESLPKLDRILITKLGESPSMPPQYIDAQAATVAETRSATSRTSTDTAATVTRPAAVVEISSATSADTAATVTPPPAPPVVASTAPAPAVARTQTTTATAKRSSASTTAPVMTLEEPIPPQRTAIFRSPTVTNSSSAPMSSSGSTSTSTTLVDPATNANVDFSDNPKIVYAPPRLASEADLGSIDIGILGDAYICALNSTLKHTWVLLPSCLQTFAYALIFKTENVLKLRPSEVTKSKINIRKVFLDF